MADRGFKHEEKVLESNGCLLVRLPSVGKDEILSRGIAMEAKRVEAFERAIGHIRKFEFLVPYACTDIKIMHVLDEAVTIACGLTNPQNPLIR